MPPFMTAPRPLHMAVSDLRAERDASASSSPGGQHRCGQQTSRNADRCRRGGRKGFRYLVSPPPKKLAARLKIPLVPAAAQVPQPRRLLRV